MQPLAGMLALDFCRYLPGAYASRELLRLGARVVRVERPGGDPMRATAPAWDAALAVGKESVVCDLPDQAAFAQALCARADIVLESFRPGVLQALGVDPESWPASVVLCSITGFGESGPYSAVAGHDLNYLGWAGALADTAPALPPVQVADLASGALHAVTQVLAALLERERTGKGERLVVSMTHRSHDLVSHRLAGDPVPRMLTGGLACYRVYTCAGGGQLTVGALESKFFERLCDVTGRPELAQRQYDEDQEGLSAELAEVFSRRSLPEWLEAFAGEDVCVGPVWTLEQASRVFGSAPSEGAYAPVGAQTEAWRAELGL